jgi:hypothetical protein
LSADGGESISAMASLADQAALFGPVASRSMRWSVVAGIGGMGRSATDAAVGNGRMVF